MSRNAIPLGLCQCGCGEATRLASVTDRSKGYVRGQPLRFVNGHRTFTPGTAPRRRRPRPVVELAPPSCEAAALYRAEKAVMLKRHAVIIADAKRAYDAALAHEAKRAKGGRPIKVGRKMASPSLGRQARTAE